MKHIISWDNDARDFFQHALSYIALRSPKNAEKVKTDILTKIG